MEWPMFIAIIAAIGAIGSAFFTWQQAKTIKNQLNQTTRYNLVNLSNQQNWDLFERYDKLPPMLPSWVGLSTAGWAWRVLILNHLNLLQLAYHEHGRKLLNEDELETWVTKSQYWFGNIWLNKSDPVYQEGRRILEQLLRPEEGAFTKDFRNWLVKKEIVPPELIQDYD